MTKYIFMALLTGITILGTSLWAVSSSTSEDSTQATYVDDQNQPVYRASALNAYGALEHFVSLPSSQDDGTGGGVDPNGDTNKGDDDDDDCDDDDDHDDDDDDDDDDDHDDDDDDDHDDDDDDDDDDDHHIAM